MRTWLPFTPNTVTVTSSPTIRVSPTRRVRISIPFSLRIQLRDSLQEISGGSPAHIKCDASTSIDQPGQKKSPLSSRPKTQKARITAPSGRALLNLSSRSVQLEGGVQSTHGQLQVLLLDDHRDLDLGGGDHLDVDGFLGQGLEHAAGDTGMGTHA